jgi:hypothetical protein
MIKAVIDGDASGLNSAINSAVSGLAKFSGRITAGLGDMVKGGVVFGLVERGMDGLINLARSAPEGIKHAFDLGGELSDLNAQTGILQGNLLILRRAFDDAGVGADKVGPSVNKMQKLLAGAAEGASEANATLYGLGISLDEVAKLTPDQQFEVFRKAIASIEDPALRAKSAMDVFGKSGGQMLALFSDDGALDAAAETLGSQAEVLNRQAANFDKISDLLGHAGDKMQGFWVGLADKFAPMLLPILERLNKLDFTGWGQQIGNAVQIIAQAFSDGRISELLSLALRVGFGEGLNYFTGAISTIVRIFGEELKTVFGEGFWVGALASLEGFGAKVGQILLTAFAEPIRSFQAGLQFAVEKVMEYFGTAMGSKVLTVLKTLSPVLGIGDMALKAAGIDLQNMGFKARSYDDIRGETNPSLFGRDAESFGQQSDDAFRRAGDAFKPVMDDLGKRVFDVLKDFKPADISDTADAQAQLGTLLTKLQAAVDQTVAAGDAKAPGSTTAPDLSDANGLGKGGRIVDSLARVGGGGSAVGAVSLQREANSILKQIAKSTAEVARNAASGLAGSSSSSQEGVYA